MSPVIDDLQSADGVIVQMFPSSLSCTIKMWVLLVSFL